MWYDSLMCDTTHSCERDGVQQLMSWPWWLGISTWLIHTWHASLIWDMTQSYVIWFVDVWHDSFICDITPWCITLLIEAKDDVCRKIDALLVMTRYFDMSHWFVTCLADTWQDSIHLWYGEYVTRRCHWSKESKSVAMSALIVMTRCLAMTHSYGTCLLPMCQLSIYSWHSLSMTHGTKYINRGVMSRINDFQFVRGIAYRCINHDMIHGTIYINVY